MKADHTTEADHPADLILDNVGKIQATARRFPGQVLLVQLELDEHHKMSAFEVFVFNGTVKENLLSDIGAEAFGVLEKMLATVQALEIPNNFQAVYQITCPHHESCGIMSFSHDNGINAKGSRVLN